MVLLPVAGIAAALREQLGQKPEREDRNQDGHVRNQHGRVAHFGTPVLRPAGQPLRLAVAQGFIPSPHIGDTFFPGDDVDLVLLVEGLACL